MKKLLYPLAFTLTAFLILYSCSAEEEDTTPPPQVQQPTPEPEPEPEVSQFTLTVTAGEGGTVSTEGGTYDEGTEVTITASPDEGYYFYTWKQIDSYSGELSIIMNENKTISPIFLPLPSDFIENPTWESQGFVMPTWGFEFDNDIFIEKDYNKIKELNKGFLEAITTGANSAQIDYHVNHTGGIGSSQMNNIESSYRTIIPMVQMASKLGLEVILKSTLGNYSENKQYDWGEIKPDNPELFFENFFDTLTEILQEPGIELVDKWLITNELKTLTTNLEYESYWIETIEKFKSVTDIEIGFNIRFGEGSHYPESRPDNLEQWKYTPRSILERLDFLGLSIYPTSWIFNLLDENVNEYTENDFINLWNDHPYICYENGNYCGNANRSSGRNKTQELKNFVDSFEIDVIVSEFGAYPYNGLSGINISEVTNESYNLDLQNEYYKATLSHFKNSINQLKGVFGYQFSPATEALNPELFTQGTSPYIFQINGKPIQNTFKDYFRNE